jgi:hypothetical protein
MNIRNTLNPNMNDGRSPNKYLNGTNQDKSRSNSTLEPSFKHKRTLPPVMNNKSMNRLETEPVAPDPQFGGSKSPLKDRPVFNYKKLTKFPLTSEVVIEDNKTNRKYKMKYKNNRNDSLEVNPNFGKIPQYMLGLNQKRRIQKHKEEILKNVYDLVPPGKRIMGEHER